MGREVEVVKELERDRLLDNSNREWDLHEDKKSLSLEKTQLIWTQSGLGR